MKISLAANTVLAKTVLATLLVGASLVGCSSGSKPSTPPSGSPTTTVTAGPASTSTASAGPASSTAPGPAIDYAKLLIDAKDISAPEAFTAVAPTSNPNGQPGVAATYSNPDGTHVIKDTILVLPDPGAAAGALDSAKTAQAGSLKGKPVPIDIGTGGTTVSGASPDGSKGVTVLLFTEGRAFVTLEFDGPPDSLVPPDFVTDVGQKQDTAIKNGLTG